MAANLATSRVNATFLPKFVGRDVRLPARVLHVSGGTATVEASDGGQVIVQGVSEESGLSSTKYAEIVCHVLDANTVKLLICTPIEEELDMRIIDKVIVHIHDPRFYSRIFAAEDSQ